jgi:putative transposase
MPRGLRRFYGAHDLHFITCSCYRRQPILGTPRRRDLFLKTLEQVRQRYRFVVVGYVVMPEHFHLLVTEPDRGTPSTVMQVRKQRFARRLHRRTRRSGSPSRLWVEETVEQVWQERFYDFNVWSEKKEIEKLRYMHRNPVKRGLVAEPDQWRWSSFRSYAYGEPGEVRINCQEWPLEIKRTMEKKPAAGEVVPALSQKARKDGAPRGF